MIMNITTYKTLYDDYNNITNNALPLLARGHI